MMDIYLRDNLALDHIHWFLSELFGTSQNHIMLMSLDEFNDSWNKHLDFTDIKCLCVYLKVHGDVSWCLQLYRYSMGDGELFQALINACIKTAVECYRAYDDFDQYLLINKHGDTSVVNLIESENESDGGLVLRAS